MPPKMTNKDFLKDDFEIVHLTIPNSTDFDEIVDILKESMKA